MAKTWATKCCSGTYKNNYQLCCGIKVNQFIDDFVGVFQYRFMDTFQYFKERKKSKYLGDRFEEWVVKNSNISKDGYSDLCDKKIFWRLLDWRGDKYIEGYRPLSSSSPDLLMECVTTTSTIHEVGDIIAVECKWRSKIGFYLDIKDIEKYEGYMNSNLLNRPIKNLFYVFGFGWCGDSPESVYVVPARELYDYDKDTCRITFPIKETEKEKMDRLERFKKKDNRCLLYIK